ncbi:Wzz/FepE/Etk N-terminal domain-containing protein [Solitalea sp. MAHUQ-68]|uniref:Wzz/FepE/Etk N-terminal domain-containing protein n=1 Tax=Solitalea agri TaxID=2953739 RepID=A0A9X2F9W2_9SPHI|nr:Wzz/FepE/Etk N-terminal domain-containing protein [Solitalea agri]MCO4293113.1 Wzz/FepE/Etk N-terminal domain-containing protein [Solitalea agri]
MNDNPKEKISTDEISLKDLIKKIKEWRLYLISKWQIILLATVLGGGVGLLYSFITKPVYTANLTFALEEDSGSGVKAYSGLASQFGIDLGSGTNGAFTGDNILELMKSRSMVERALLTSVNINGKKESLADYYIGVNKLREKWANNPELSKVSFTLNSNPDKFTRLQDSLIGNFYENLFKKSLTVDKVDKKLSIISVKCKSKDELFAKSFIEALVSEVSDFYIRTKTGRSKKNVDILQAKADSIKSELYKALYGKAVSIDQVPNLNPIRQVAIVGGQKKEFEVQILATAYGEVLKNLEISKISLLKETPFIQVIDKPVFPLSVDKVSKIKSFIIGAFLFGFLSGFFLLIKYIYKELIAD